MISMCYLSNYSGNSILDDLTHIMHVSSTFNTIHTITGMLLYYQDTFLQYLEGPFTKSNELFFDRICRDTRHNSIKLIHYKRNPSLERLFPEWSMACVDMTNYETLPKLSWGDPWVRYHPFSKDFKTNLENMKIIYDFLRK